MIVSVSWLGAGDIVGTVGVPKPDHALVYVNKVPGTFHGGNAQMDQEEQGVYSLPATCGAGDDSGVPQQR